MSKQQEQMYHLYQTDDGWHFTSASFTGTWEEVMAKSKALKKANPNLDYWPLEV